MVKFPVAIISDQQQYPRLANRAAKTMKLLTRFRPRTFPVVNWWIATLILTSIMPWPGGARAAGEVAIEQWQGNFEEMLERRQIRALVAYNKLLYFLDGPQQRGASYEALQEFRKFIDKKFELKTRKFNVIYIPVTRDQLIPALLSGIGDVAVANLTITPERLQQVDFTDPIVTGVREVLVTGPTAPNIQELDDLAGKEIYVRESSSYFTSLSILNQQFEANDMEPIRLKPADEHLEDSDLLEMVNAGLLPMIIVDSHKANFWKDIFDQLTITEIAVSLENSIGWAFRKDSPTLQKMLNQFVATSKKGTLTGNIIINRYLRDNKWVRNPLAEAEMERFRSMAELFQTYAGEYQFDWLMLIALGYQESRLDHSVKSPSGAIGVMQMLKSTAIDPNVNIPDIEVLEKNIHAGTKYLRFLRDRYFADSGADPLNQTLLTFASYNAGPAKIARLRKETRESGLDPNVWFGNVEHIVAKKIGRETVQYVSNIYKYYIAYTLVVAGTTKREAAKETLIKTLD